MVSKIFYFLNLMWWGNVLPFHLISCFFHKDWVEENTPTKVELGKSQFQDNRAEIHPHHKGYQDSNWQRGEDLLQRNEAIGLPEDDEKM